MNENGRFSDFAEVWTSANRMRTLFLTSLVTSVIAALIDGWKKLRGHRQEGHDASRPLTPAGRAVQRT